jgi:hypothetical protein
MTTFSDHLVFSYPVERLTVLGEGWLDATLFMAQPLIAAIASAALSLGLLIRGGATIDKLYHSGGVVLGRAMVDAHALESKVATYPRIVVSRKIYSQLKTDPRESVLLTDRDGIAHINYFQRMFFAGGGEPGDHFKKRLHIWHGEASRMIADNVARFEGVERWNEFAKWVWFKERFEHARATLQPFFE